MSWRIIDIAEDGRYLHTERNWLVVEEKGREAGRAPLCDVQSVLVHAGHATYSHGLLLQLSAHDIPLVVCDKRHEPVAILLSLCGHHRHAGRVRAQTESSLPLRKRIWRDLVRKKISEQARSLDPFDATGRDGLDKLTAKVRVGDPDNIEARAARYYWPRLFGDDFRRDRTRSGLNAHLNYGYTILRSALARAVTAAGLAPSLGVGHLNARNNFCLADDLLEPFRPLVDRLVLENREAWKGDITPEARSELAGMMARTILTDDGETDLYRAMTLVVNSLADLFEKKAKKLYLPKEIAFITTPRLPGMEARHS
jgi:CRISPR-associated protein Cas1